MKTLQQIAKADSTRRHLLGSSATACALALCGLTPPTRAAVVDRLASRARFRLAEDYAAPPFSMNIVPWAVVEFQSGADVQLQSGGKILILTQGLYDLVFSCDWDATHGTDIDLRRIGMRRQRLGQPDEPATSHERQGYLNVPGSDPPRMARFQGAWAPPHLALGTADSIDVTVAPVGIVSPGDLAQAAHNKVSDATMLPASVAALVIQAKVVAPDTVRVTFSNPSVAEGIDIPNGQLKVLAMTANTTRGSSGDAWAVLHSASAELDVGDRIYGVAEHKVAGTLLQASRSSFLQIDRLG